MSAPNAGPGAEAPGAPAAGGQAVGAGVLAPGAANEGSPEVIWVDVEQLKEQLKELEEQLRAELIKECYWIGKKMNYINSDPQYYSYTYNALLTYDDIAFRFPVHAETVESIMRVIGVCRKASTTKLIDYVPDVLGIVKRLKRALDSLAEEEEEAEDEEEREEIATERADIAEIVKRLEGMTYVEFLDEGEDIIETLNKYEYYDTAKELEIYVDVNSMLSDVLVEELRILGRKFNIEHEVERLINCMVGC